MKSNKGITLVEILVVMVITIIMLIAVGAVSEVGQRGHKSIATESDLYNDIAYGFKLMQNRVHETGSIDDSIVSTPWIGEKLIAGDEAFGVYDQGANGKDFVHLPDKDDDSDRRTILSVLSTDTMTLDVDHGAEPITKVIVTLSGTKHGIPFNMSTTIKKRI